MAYKPDASEVREYLAAAVQHSGMHATALALKAKVSQTTLTRSLQDDYTGVARPHTLSAISAASGLPLPPNLLAYASHATGGQGNRKSDAKLLQIDDAAPFDPEQIRPGAELVGQKDLPIYASAEGGPYGMTISYDPIDYVKRPEPLMKVKGAFGFYVVGDSMAPRYEPGDLLLVHPSKPPVRNDYVLVLLRDGLDGQVDAIVKRFLGWDGDKLRLDQFNPPGEIKPIPRDRVHNLHLVVGSYGRRG